MVDVTATIGSVARRAAIQAATASWLPLSLARLSTSPRPPPSTEPRPVGLDRAPVHAVSERRVPLGYWLTATVSNAAAARAAAVRTWFQAVQLVT